MLRKLFLTLSLLILCAGAARATDIQVGSIQTPQIYRGTENTLVLRIYASETFTDSTGRVVLGSPVGSTIYFPTPCAVVSAVVTCTAITLPSTTDSSRKSATYTGVLYTSTGAQKMTLFSNWKLSPSLGSSITFAQWETYARAPSPPLGDAFYNKEQVDSRIASAVSGSGAPYASNLTRGIAKTSVLPSDIANPVVVGLNDPILKMFLPRFNPENYGGISSDSTDDRAAFVAANAAADAAGGGIISVPNNGTWYISSAVTLSSGVTIEGVANKESGGSRIVVTGASGSAFLVPGLTRNVSFKNLTFATNTTGAIGILAQGTYPDSTFGLSVDSCVFESSLAYGLKIHSLPSIISPWESNIMSVTNSQFYCGTAGIFCDTVNSSLFVGWCLFIPRAGADAMRFDQIGPLIVMNSTSAGISGITPECVTGDPNPAESRRFVWINGEHGTVSIIGSASEGMQEFLRVSFASYTWPINVEGSEVQDRVTLEADCIYNSHGNGYRRTGVKASDDVIIYSRADSLLNKADGTHQDDCGVASVIDSPFATSGGALLINEENPTTLVNTVRAKTVFQDPGTTFYPLATPVVSVSSEEVAKPLLRLGTASNYYEVGRDANGWLDFFGNQTSPSTGYRGASFDGLELRTTASPIVPPTAGRLRIYNNGTMPQFAITGGAVQNFIYSSTAFTAGQVPKMATAGSMVLSLFFDNGSNAQITSGGLTFGGYTSSQSGFFRSGTALKARLADNSADAPFSAAAATFSGTLAGTNAVFSGAVSGTTGTFTGALSTTKATTAGVVTLTDAANIATDASLGNLFRVTLGGNRTLSAPTNPTNGQVCVWEIIQDATGSRTLTLDAVFTFGSTVASYTATATASKRDFLTAVYNSTTSKWYVQQVVKGY